MKPIEIDGSMGEGGGQVLRSCLTLSLLTGRPFRLTKIRAKRSKPGLMRLHSVCVNAARAISNADVAGNSIGSTEIYFAPRVVASGDHSFSIGSAGSTTLVLQTILLPLLFGGAGPSSITIEGGTHNKMAPPFEFLEETYLAVLRSLGANVSASLLRHGFYPAGGGSLRVEIVPLPSRLSTLDLTSGLVKAVRAMCVGAQLPRHVLEREAHVVQKGLREIQAQAGIEISPEMKLIKSVHGTQGPGNVLLAWVQYETFAEVISVFGERGVASEQVAESLLAETRGHLATGAPVGEHLADQLILPLVLSKGGTFATGELSLHARTQIDLVKRWLGVDIVTERAEGQLRVVIPSSTGRLPQS